MERPNGPKAQEQRARKAARISSTLGRRIAGLGWAVVQIDAGSPPPPPSP